MKASVHQTPMNSEDEGSQKEHRIQRPNMHTGIQAYTDDRSFGKAVFFHKFMLNKAAPENFLGRSNEKEQQWSDDSR